MEVYFHAFLKSPLDGGELLASRLNRFTPWERAPGTLWIGSGVTKLQGNLLESRSTLLCNILNYLMF